MQDKQLGISSDNSIHPQRFKNDETIAEFLNRIGVSELVPLFESHRIRLDMLPSISDSELKEIGVRSLGHRKLILDAASQEVFTFEASKAKVMEDLYCRRTLVTSLILSLILFLPAAVYSPGDVPMFLGIVVFLWVYMLPSIVAWSKMHVHRWAILLVNIFFGLSLFGWVVCVVLAFKKFDATTAITLGALKRAGVR